MNIKTKMHIALTYKYWGKNEDDKGMNNLDHSGWQASK